MIDGQPVSIRGTLEATFNLNDPLPRLPKPDCGDTDYVI
jgi:hypothetical protein